MGASRQDFSDPLADHPGGESMIMVAGVSAWLGVALLAPPMAGQDGVLKCAEGCTAQGMAQPAAADPQQPPQVDPSVRPAPLRPETPEQEAPEQEHILVSARRHVRYDPLEKVNKVSFDAVQAVDKAVVGPLAGGYEHIVPEPARDGIHNAVHNLREPYIAINFLLQHRVGKSAETVARFLINSTVGMAGLFDIAKRKPFHLPRRPNGFADTMAFYGVRSGPYLYLPIVGPTTVRDLVGNTLDRLVIPLSVGRLARNPAYGAPLVVFGAMDRRLQNNASIEAMRGARDPYVARREEYLQRRRLEIEGLHHHRPRKEAQITETPKAESAQP
jgi:phospholipid-binding lipoprotein MlaA